MEQAIGRTRAWARRNADAADSGAYEIISRIVQVMLSVGGMIVLAPVMAMVALAIKMVSPGPVFYRGQRVGKGEKPFTIYKFRTLQVDAEEKIGGRLLKIDDPFYHRMGRFLKKSKLDEVPQLFNVIRGDMNLVGPRPIRPVFLEKSKATIPGYALRFKVRPGMTGLAQLRGGYYTEVQNKLRYDEIYIRRRSLRLDFVILMMTFLKLLQRWVTAATLLCLMVLFVSFVPTSVMSSFSIRLFAVQFNPVLPAILAVGVYLALHAGKSNKWLVSHSAIDGPILAFVLVSAMAIPFSVSPITAFRGLVYLCITGFFFAFVMVNMRPDEHFARRAAQLVSVAGGGVALLTVAEVLASGAGLLGGAARANSTLGSPVALTAYLALCFPLVLCECLAAKTRNTRLLWVAVAAAIVSAVLSAGTVLGVPALLVAAGVLLVKTKRLSLRTAAVWGGVCLVALSVAGGDRHSLPVIAGQAVEGGRAAVQSIRQASLDQLLIGYGTKTTVQSGAYASISPLRPGYPQNTYLTLLFENGIAGFCLMTWMGALVLREISISAKNRQDEIQLRLWSLAAAICGVGVAAVSFNVFYNMATQLVFWGVIGLALGLSVRCSGHDHGAVLVMRFGH